MTGYHCLPRTIALNPSVLGEDKAVELFTEVLNHVVALWLAVDKEVQANLLLESNNLLDLLLNEILILLGSELALSELETSGANLLRLLNRKQRKHEQNVQREKLTGKEPIVVVGNFGMSRTAFCASQRLGNGLLRW